MDNGNRSLSDDTLLIMITHRLEHNALQLNTPRLFMKTLCVHVNTEHVSQLAATTDTYKLLTNNTATAQAGSVRLYHT